MFIPFSKNDGVPNGQGAMAFRVDCFEFLHRLALEKASRLFEEGPIVAERLYSSRSDALEFAASIWLKVFTSYSSKHLPTSFPIDKTSGQKQLRPQSTSNGRCVHWKDPKGVQGHPLGLEAQWCSINVCSQEWLLRKEHVLQKPIHTWIQVRKCRLPSWIPKWHRMSAHTFTQSGTWWRIPHLCSHFVKVAYRSRISSRSLRLEMFNLLVGRLCSILRARATICAYFFGNIWCPFDTPKFSSAYLHVCCSCHLVLKFAVVCRISSLILLHSHRYIQTIPNYPKLYTFRLPQEKHVMIPPFYHPGFPPHRKAPSILVSPGLVCWASPALETFQDGAGWRW